MPTRRASSVPKALRFDRVGRDMNIGCLITNYESWELTLQSVESVLKHGEGLHRCVVVDDCSRSASPQSPPLDQIHVHRNQRNVGYVRSVNIGIGLLSNCEIIIVLDCDSRLLGNPIPEIVTRFRENGRLGALAMFEQNPGGLARIAGEPEPVLSEFLLGQAASDLLTRFRRNGNRRFVAHSCSLVLRRSAFESVQGFDESFDFLDADVDFSIRLLNAGWQIEPAPELRCFHKGSGSLQSADKRTARFHRNRFHLLKKHNHIRYELPVKCILATRHLAEIAWFTVARFFRPSRHAAITEKIRGRSRLLRSVWARYEDSILPGP